MQFSGILEQCLVVFFFVFRTLDLKGISGFRGMWEDVICMIFGLCGFQFSKPLTCLIGLFVNC